MTNAWLVAFLIYTTRVTLSDIVMLEIPHNNGFRTLILPEILKTRNRPRGESCVSLWQSHVCSVSWMCKKQTVKVYAWLEFPLLISGIWFLKCCILPSTRQRNPKRKCRETCCVTKPSRKHTNTQAKTEIQHSNLELSIVEYVSSNAMSSRSGAMLYIFE